MDTVQRAIRERRSVTRVADTPVERARLNALIEAALWAPNHKLTLPWRFVVVSGDARDALGDAHADARRRLDPGLTPEGALAQRALTRRAPHIIVCAVRHPGDDPVARREDRDAVSAGIQNMLAAHADGLGAVWRTGPFVDEPEVRAHLGCGPGEEIVGFVYVGLPDGDAPPAPPRPATADVAEWRDG